MSIQDQLILLAHGGGGRLTNDLVKDLFVSSFDNQILSKMGDSSLFNVSGTRLALTTDSFVIKPIFFPGGDIGHLAVCGTVNDLAVSGAYPLYLSAGFIIEEGFKVNDLRTIILSMKRAADAAGVKIIAGDTKVVERGSADGLFINTTGIGAVKEGLLSPFPINPGDAVIVNGPLGDHGIAVLSARENLPVESEIISDAACLNELIFSVLETFPGKVKFMRDATRGGFATVLNEMAEGASFGVTVYEDRIPVNESVRAVCDLLGFDPLYLANEGKIVMITEKDAQNEILKHLRKCPFGAKSEIVGEITTENKGTVILKTTIGGGRILDMLIGDQLPRIC